MGYTLVVSEKPSVCKDIFKIISNGKGRAAEGYIESDGYIFTHAIGHLVVLCEPEDYDEKYKVWSLDTLPFAPEVIKYKVNPKTAKQFNVVKQLMNRSDIDCVVNACDPAREGEAIFMRIYMLSGCKKPVKRLWISSQTELAIREGFKNLKPANDYANLRMSAECRAIADQVVGLTVSRAYSIVNNHNLPQGRIMSPTLALLVNRHTERENFIPEDYWQIKALYDGFNGVWFDKDTKESRLSTKDKAELIVKKISNKSGVVKDIKNTHKKEAAPQLFDLTELQSVCNRKFGYTIKKALNITQSLYEKKLVTYPRTDSKYLSSDIVGTLSSRLAAVNYPPFGNIIEFIKASTVKLSSRYVNDSKVSDHHAIIPTEVSADFDSLSDEERKVYDLIVRRFLAIFLPPFEYMSTTVVTAIDDENFKSNGRTLLKHGWMILYKNEKERDSTDSEETEQSIPIIKIGDKLNVEDIQLLEKQTQAPPLYTESSLVLAMENAGKFVDDEELKEQLKEGGLGTVATRADIVEKLIKVGYVERNKKYLLPTNDAIKLIAVVPSELKSPELTAKWEKALNLIARGQYPPEKFISSIKQYATFLVNEAKKCQGIEFGNNNSNNAPLGDCKLCNGDVIENAKGWSCSNWKETGCNFFIRKEHPYLQKFNKKVTTTMVKALLRDGFAKVSITDPKTKVKFEKEVSLLHEGQYWNIKFENPASKNISTKLNTPKQGIDDNNTESNATYSCPSCKKGELKYVKSSKFIGWGCSSWKDGCKLFIPIEKCGVKLEPYMPQLSIKGETEAINNFISQSGNKFTAKLIIKEGKLDMEFINKK